MAVAPRFHPGCDEARALRSHHEKETAFAKDLHGSRLAKLVTERQGKAYAEHDAECPTCWSYARTCLECGAMLVTAPHKFSCAHNKRRWKGLLKKPTPPLAAEARRRPVPLETPPPRRVPLEPMPKKTAAKPAPPPAAKAAAPAPPPAQKRVAKATPHEVLDLKPGATVSEIRVAYREKALEYHPDRVATLGPELQRLAEQRMRLINEAYEELLRMAAKAK